MTQSTQTRKKTWAKVNLLTSLVLILPLLIFYEIGVLFSNVMNGADLITQTLLQLVGLKGFLIVQGALLLIIIIIAIYLRKVQRFENRLFLPVVLESLVYSATMGTLILFVMVDLLHIDPRLASLTFLEKPGFFDRIIMSVGAGVHEELIFRMILYSSLIAINEKFLKLRRWIAVALAMLISAIVFSAAHHIGPLGEQIRLGIFLFRAIAGICFAVLYHFRSLAVAVYTHMFYDIYVLLLH